MSSESLRQWLALAHLPQLQPAIILQVLERIGSPDILLRTPIAGWGLPAPSPGLRSMLLDWQQQRPTSKIVRGVDEQLRQLEQSGDNFICCLDDGYPNFLRMIPDPPLALFVRGNRALLENRQLAVVGSRKASAAGRRTAFELSAQAAALGLTVTSGLARGIDGAAHRGALSVGGQSIAVVATGLDIYYPRQHRELHVELAEHGAVVSECLYGSPPRREAFPRRNRIISGLSEGVLVVEAALPSGSLITARLAADQGREVFAVPGSIYGEGSRGCHYLLRDGAALVENINDIARELGGLEVVRPERSEAVTRALDLPEVERAVLAATGYEPTLLEELTVALDCPVSELMPVLSALEMRGLLEQRAGGYQRT